MTWGECAGAMLALLVALIVLLVWVVANDPDMGSVNMGEVAGYQWQQMVDGCRVLEDGKQSECLALADASFR